MSSKLKRLEISSLKCFRSCEIALNGITVLTGTNSGGKTTILQSLLLLKYFAGNLGDASSVDEFPQSIGGIAVGPRDSFFRFGEDELPTIRLNDGNRTDTMKLGTTDGEPGSSQVCLDNTWRVFSTVHLPLNSEQDIGQRSLDKDSIYDHGHALMEYLRFEVKRKPGSSNPDVNLRSVVEGFVKDITVPTFVELTETQLEGKLKLSYTDTSLEAESTPPEQYGTGVTAILPLAIHIAAAIPGEVLVVQDPEAHLHPHGQSMVGRKLAACSARGIQVVVETHSEHVVNGIKLGLLDERLNPAETLSCYYISRANGETSVERVLVDERGLTRSWPRGFFDQAELDLAYLASISRHGN